MASYPISRALPAPSPSRMWFLPSQGLTVFHGHPNTPRLFHYFLPRLVAEGKQIVCLDGANRFDPLLVARFARQRAQAASVFNEHVRVARAFTCFQLTELLARVPRMLRDFPANAVIVTALPDLYFDEDVREREATASFRKALEALQALVPLPLSIAVFSDASSFRTPRRALFTQLAAQANQVWRFAVQDNDKLTLIGEKNAPQPPRFLS